MAGFLFRKQKQDHNNNKKGSIVISSPTTLQSPPSTPVHARFAASSPRDTNGGSTSPVRKVSVPKPLGNQNRGQRGEKVWNGMGGKYGYSNNSLTSVDRDGQRRNVNVAQQPQINGEHTLARPASQSLLDKPLPPPVPPAEDKPTNIATTTLATPRPTAFPTQQQLLGRVSLNSEKPLPRPGSSQSFLPMSTSSSSKTSFSRTSVSTSPSIAKIQRQRSTSTSNQPTSEDPSQTESTSDAPPAGTSQNGPISETPLSTLSSTSIDDIDATQRTAGQETSSQRVIDYPGALSSQNFNEINHVPSQSSSFNSRRPLIDRGASSVSGKSFDRQNLVSTPPAKEGDMTSLLEPAPSLVKLPTSRRDLPSPPPTSISSKASSLSRTSVISAYHELYPSHVIMDNERRHSVLETYQQHPPLHRNQSVAQPSYHIPPPANSQTLHNGISERQSLRISRNKTQQHSYPEQQHATLTSPRSHHVSLTKAPSNVSLARGKPRIFAAMEAQDNGRLHPLPRASPLPQEIQPNPQAPSLARPSLEEEYSTPKLQFESLPEIESNGDVDFSSTAKAIEPHNVAPGLEPPPVRSRKSSASRSVARQDGSRKQSTPPTPRTKKLSKVRQPADSAIHAHTSNGSTSTFPGAQEGGQQKKLHKTLSKNPLMASSESEPTILLDEETIRKAGIPLDDDPFAKVEGVKMLKPTSTSTARHKSSKENASLTDELKEALGRSQQDSISQVGSATHANRQTRKDKQEKPSFFLFDPTLKKEPPEPATMPKLLLNSQILANLLQYLSFFEWCILLSLSKDIRSALVRNAALRETALERFLKTIGYSRWIWADEPLSLSLQDLSDYMRGVSTPTHEYARVSAMYIHSLKMHTTHRDPSIRQIVQRFVASTRAYNRVLLRLRAQAEKEASLRPSAQARPQSPDARTINARLSPTTRGGNSSRTSSRAPSPAASHSSINFSLSNGHFPGSFPQGNSSQTNLAFHSPLFKLRRAPLLRVFVPSPEGDWLSDKSVLECEAECKRAGVQQLLRLGDVVWDVAVGDEGNVGRLVWDGSYLIDLDYTYSVIGDLPKYLPAFSFPPSYFHRVIRTGHSSSNPIVHVDITPWGQEIATNLQLTQDRVRTETPQGAYHNLMRWVHRSSFQLRPVRGQQPGGVNRIPIPNTDSLFVDSGWYGTIVVETEGTNEGLADLQDRCGLGIVPRPRASVKPTQAQIENRRVFRILRERSRPGEIWIRAISMKERLL